jgi:hypothetical protein
MCIITGSQKEQLAVESDMVEEFQPEEPAQEVQAEKDASDELQECSDHRPNSFERGKPRSISPSVRKYLMTLYLN